MLVVQVSLDETDDEAAERGREEGRGKDEHRADDAFPLYGEGDDEIDEDGDPGSEEGGFDGPGLFARSLNDGDATGHERTEEEEGEAHENSATLVVVEVMRGEANSTEGEKVKRRQEDAGEEAAAPGVQGLKRTRYFARSDRCCVTAQSLATGTPHREEEKHRDGYADDGREDVVVLKDPVELQEGP